MFFSSWLRNRMTNPHTSRTAARRRPARFRPGLEILEGRDVPSTLTVTTPLDEVNPNDGVLSLREAIQQANPATPGGDTIVFDSSLNRQAITLNGNELLIDKNLNIQGPGDTLLAISGNHLSRVFELAAYEQVTLAGLTIRDGNDPGFGSFLNDGGGIYNNGALTVSGCTFSSNSASRSGGAIINGGVGTLSLSGSTFSGNSSSNQGGAIMSVAGGNTVKASDCIFSGNSSAGVGGAIFGFGGWLTLTRCTFSGNWALAGGAIDTGGVAMLTGCTFSNNSARFTSTGVYVGKGGAISTSGNMTLTGCTFTANVADEDGGGVFNSNVLAVGGCTFSGNSARGIVTSTGVVGGSGGGLCNVNITGAVTIAPAMINHTFVPTTFSNNSALTGGAICNAPYNAPFPGYSVTVSGCTITGNSADIGCGIYNAYLAKGMLTIQDSTITSNTATSKGGGIYNNGAASIQNTKVSNNSAGAQGGGIFNDVKGALTLYYSSIVSGNLAPEGADIDNFGHIFMKKG